MLFLGLIVVFGALLEYSEARCLEDPCYYYAPPRIVDTAGNSLYQILVGQQVSITTDVGNNEKHDQPFVVFVQMINQDNTVEYLNWMSGILSPDHRLVPLFLGFLKILDVIM